MIRPTLFALFGLILHGDAAEASLFCLIPETPTALWPSVPRRMRKAG